MSTAQLTYDLERAAKNFREASDLLDKMRAGEVNVDLSIAHTYCGSKLDEGETADLIALATAYCERQVNAARDRLIDLGLKPEILEDCA